uniref:Thioredoxin-like_fold domain-containing protein n=1 Tax=Syphacia muris TaxID=451379 RepID=A0A0N5APZ5_9BILA
MSFADLYDCIFKKLLLRQFPSTKLERSSSIKGRNGNSESISLDQLINRSRYLAFYLISSSGGRASELITPLKRLQQIRNGGNISSTKTSPARLRRFFGVVHKSKKTRLLETRDIDVVVLDVDHKTEEQCYSVFTDSKWFTFMPMSLMTKSRLLRSLKYQLTPSLVILDTASRQVVSTDGRRIILEDPDGTTFPWLNPLPEQLFDGPILKNSTEGSSSEGLVTIAYKDLPSTIKGLYFAANWCPPCRSLTKQLSITYKNLKAAGVPFEIFFCSSDRSEESFQHHFSTMPWLAFPFDHEKLNLLSRIYNVNGIPAFLILDEKNNLITRHGRNAVLGDPTGKFFPWGPQLMFELNEYTLCRLQGTPEDVSFSVDVLRPLAGMLFAETEDYLKRSPSKDSNNSQVEGYREGSSSSASPDLTQSSNSVDSASSAELSLPSFADPLQVFYTGEDPICDLVLEGLKLGDAELPMIVIVDVIGGVMTVCQKPDVSTEIIEEFVSSYRSGSLEMVPLPSTCQNTGKQIGGIPLKVVHQALGIENSVTQRSANDEKVAVSPTVQNANSSVVL